jgi:hypothetical protein
MVKVGRFVPDGTYGKAYKAGRATRSRNGTRFSVQEYMMGLSEEQEGPEEVHGLPHILKSRNSAVFEILSKDWHEEHNV